MAAAMVGSASSPPLWTGQDWRPILGTSMDTRILPPSLSEKRKCTPAQSVDSPAPLMTCTSVLLTAGFRLPKSMSHLVLIVMLLRILFESCLWILGPPHTLIMLFGPQKADQGHASKTAKHEESQTPGEAQTQNKVLPAPEVLVTLRLQVDSCRPAELSALIKILLGGTPVSCRNRQLWIQAVQDYFDVKWSFSQTTSASLGDSSSGGVQCVFGQSRWEPPIRWPCGTVSRPCFPGCRVHVHIRTQNAVVRSSSFDDPQLVNIDCTGLGGHDLGGFKDYDICIRTDKHSQSIYGPSVTPLESPGFFFWTMLRSS